MGDLGSFHTQSFRFFRLRAMNRIQRTEAPLKLITSLAGEGSP